ncbi:MAG: O-antigen ligase family protein [Gemmatimonadota bacterium]|nr:O-antigen ligase family protein [Gemmatimonadota bacterium]
MASTTLPTLSNPSQGSREGSAAFAPWLTDRHNQAMVVAALGVVLILLASTMDAIWLDRGSFSGASTFDALAAFKLAARGLAVALAAWLMLHLGPGRWIVRDPAVLLFTVFFAYAAITSAYSAVPMLSLTRALSFLGILFFAVVLVRFVTEAGRFELFWNGLYHVLGGYVALIFVASLVLDAAGLRGTEGRLASLYGPNGAASLAGLAFIWSYVRLAGGRWSAPCLVFLMVSGAFLVLALSRGALLTVVATCALYAVWRRRGVVSVAVVVAVTGVVLVAVAGSEQGPAGLSEFFTRGHDLERIQAMNGRVPVYLYLLMEQFPQYPWFGVGFQMMSESGLEVDIPAHIVARRGSWLPGHAHNAILQILVGTGLVGLALYGAAWAATLRGLAKRVRVAAPEAFEALMPLTLFILANSMVETTLTGTIDPNYVIATIAVGTCAATYPMDR